MFGGVRPGCNEIRAVLLADKGYAVLALAYFGGEGQPAMLDEVESLEIEYFEVIYVIIVISYFTDLKLCPCSIAWALQ